jgi:hypothetical protein
MKRYGLVVLISGLLAACGSSQSVVKQMDRPATVVARFHLDSIEDRSGESAPGQFLASIQGYLESDLKQQNLLAADVDRAPRAHIEVTNYRMRGGITRAMFGAMAGKDGVESKVTVLAPGSDQVIGASDVSTFNIMAFGGPDDIARMHADKIAAFLAGDKSDPKANTAASPH